MRYWADSSRIRNAFISSDLPYRTFPDLPQLLDSAARMDIRRCCMEFPPHLTTTTIERPATRCFSLTFSPQSSTAATRKRRVAKSLVPSKLRSPTPNVSVIVTDRDRIRLLVQTNRRRTVPPTLFNAPNELIEVAQGRLAWVRNKMYTYWNPDYKEGSSDLASASAEQMSIRRPTKPGLVMDARWWMLNLLFALLPACTIAIYCEFRGKDVVRDFQRSQRLIELRKVLGDEKYNAYSNSQLLAMLEAREAAEQEPNFFTDAAIPYLSAAVATLEATVRSMVWPSSADNGIHAADDKVDLTVKSVDQKEVEPNKIPGSVPEASSQAEKLVKNTVPLTVISKHGEQDPSLQELLIRIQSLEETLRNSSTSKSPLPDDDSTNKELPVFPPPQSGVRQRVDDQLHGKWRPFLHVPSNKSDDDRHAILSSSKQTNESNRSSQVAWPDILRETLSGAQALWTRRNLERETEGNKRSYSTASPEETAENTAQHFNETAPRIISPPHELTPKETVDTSATVMAMDSSPEANKTARSWWNPF